MSRDSSGEGYAEYVERMKKRTKAFGIGIIRLIDQLPRSTASGVLAGQLIRAGTAVGANYRAACRTRTDKEFVNKLRIVLEEADESQYWLEVIAEGLNFSSPAIPPLHKEASELTAIFTKAHDTARKRLPPQK